MKDAEPAHVESSGEVYANEWLTIREDHVRYPSGRTGPYAVLEGPDIAMVVATTDGRVHLVDQYRHPVGGRRWEFPSGNVERSDASPAAAAVRELGEETGLRSRTMIGLGTLDVLPSTSTQTCSVFLATDPTPGPAGPDPDEDGLRTQSFERSEFERMIANGTVSDSRTVAAYALLLLHETRRHQGS